MFPAVLRHTIRAVNRTSAPVMFPAVLRHTIRAVNRTSAPVMFPAVLRHTIRAVNRTSAPVMFPAVLRHTIRAVNRTSAPVMFPAVLRHTIRCCECCRYGNVLSRSTYWYNHESYCTSLYDMTSLGRHYCVVSALLASRAFCHVSFEHHSRFFTAHARASTGISDSWQFVFSCTLNFLNGIIGGCVVRWS